MKPPLAYLHKKGHISVARLDDLYLQGQSYEQCVHNVIDTTVLFDQMGLAVHPEKSTLEPRQKLAILGFVIDTVSMTIQLTSDKATKLKHACIEMLKHQRPSIRSVASLIGQLAASFPGVMFGPLSITDISKEIRSWPLNRQRVTLMLACHYYCKLSLNYSGG